MEIEQTQHTKHHEPNNLAYPWYLLPDYQSPQFPPFSISFLATYQSSLDKFFFHCQLPLIIILSTDISAIRAFSTKSTQCQHTIAQKCWTLIFLDKPLRDRNPLSLPQHALTCTWTLHPPNYNFVTKKIGTISQRKKSGQRKNHTFSWRLAAFAHRVQKYRATGFSSLRMEKQLLVSNLPNHQNSSFSF